MPTPLLQVDELRIAFGERPVVDGVSFSLAKGSITALVGESGSGKSLTARALLGLLPENPRPSRTGTIRWTDDTGTHELSALAERAWTEWRGRRIGLVLQEPMSSLNPVRRIGTQLRESLPASQRANANTRIADLLHRVGLGSMPDLLRRYPHQLSGGQLQRVCIALALLGAPQLLIADEPTTALDRRVQLDIVRLLRELRDQLGLTLLFITHDLQLVRHLAERTLVMHRGRIVERNATATLFAQPAAPYTKQLLHQPAYSKRSFDPQTPILLEGRHLRKRFVTRRSFWGSARGHRTVFDDLAIQIRRGETVGLLGDSGSGKTTLGRCLLGLEPLDGGSLHWSGKALDTRAERTVAQRLYLQLIFQNPYAALTPRRTVGQLLEEPLRAHQIVPPEAVPAEMKRLLRLVGLDPALFQLRFPAQLSGGERQRVAIARALSVRPQLLVCDECLSALDHAIREQILALLDSLRRDQQLALLFISHDETTVRRFADRVYTLANGRLTPPNGGYLPPGAYSYSPYNH